ncbi:MAG: biotin transporter BioY, partial [Pseudomonadota bacterium]
MQQIISIRTSAINIAQVILGILAIWASAEISIPLKPVAITLHTVTVMAICLTYTPILARSTVLGYLL